ncbi:hypothetical protein ACHAXN_009122 [Cyclotella atomus]
MKAARFLMIYILRHSAAAFATVRNSAPPTCSSALRFQTSNSAAADQASDASDNNSRPLLSSGHITYRLARTSDIPQIQSCNLATLPENYNDQFYRNHMRQWPELALVCEYIPDGLESKNSHQKEDGITPLSHYLGRVRANKGAEAPKKEIVGYILGKVEDRPILHQPASPARRPPSKVVPLYDPYTGQPNTRWDRPQWEKTGHVTSLAVHSHARRLGIASSLLHQLHYHLSECYSANAVGLHVRISNAAAVKLYVETLEYDVADIIPQYYGDGEDAYFMRKELARWSELNRVERRPVQQQQERRMQNQGNQIPDWVNRDNSKSSFFDNRSSMRDMLSPEERAWVNTNNGRSLNYSLTGKMTRSFRTFLNGGEQVSSNVTQNYRRVDGWSQQQRPPWETGPEELKLPRYSKIVRRDVETEKHCDFVRGGGQYEEVVTASGTVVM